MVPRGRGARKLDTGHVDIMGRSEERRDGRRRT